jgi:adenylate kinase
MPASISLSSSSQMSPSSATASPTASFAGPCGGVFRAGLHVALPSDPCPRCRGPLTRRADDNLDALADRLAEYRTKTEPVIAYYQARGILHPIDGNRPVETVFADFTAALQDTTPAGA